jgi:L-lysine 2,3-aminomutase
MQQVTSIYQPLTRHNIDSLPQFRALAPELQHDIQVVSTIFPFRTNRYLVEHLIDWDRVPDDPIYQLTFPQRGMLSEEDFARVSKLLRTQPCSFSPAGGRPATLTARTASAGRSSPVYTI